MLLLPLRFMIKLHLYSSNSSNEPASYWAHNHSNGAEPEVASQITEVACAAPGLQIEQRCNSLMQKTLTADYLDTKT